MSSLKQRLKSYILLIPLLTVFNASSLNHSPELTHAGRKKPSDFKQTPAVKPPADTAATKVLTDSLSTKFGKKKPINALPAHYVCEIGQSGAPVLCENADSIIHPASLIKPALAMAYFKFKNDSLFANTNPDTLAFIEERLRKALIRSHNKAADDVALFLTRTLYPEAYGKNSKQENIQLYTDKIINPILASDVGLQNTRITNANGLDGSTISQEYKGKYNKVKNEQPERTPEKRMWYDWTPTGDNYSSTRDLAKLYEHIYLHYPEIVAIMAEKEFQGKPNTNPFFRDSFKDTRVFSGKTGFIDQSGYNMAAFAEINGKPFIVLSLGNKNGAERRKTVTRLMNHTQAFAKDSLGVQTIAHQNP